MIKKAICKGARIIIEMLTAITELLLDSLSIHIPEFQSPTELRAASSGVRCSIPIWPYIKVVIYHLPFQRSEMVSGIKIAYKLSLLNFS